jgi:hypothetical protein
VKGTPAQLHQDVAVGFGADDGILIEGLSLGPQNLSVTYGSAVLNFDTDLDGGTDFTLRLEGDFSTGTFKVSPHAAGTLVTYAPPLGVAARTDAYVTLGGQAVTIPATSGVLANDLTRTTPVASLVTGAERGTLALEADGRLTYDPSQGFTGIDRFSYRLTDGGATALAEALVYVIPVRTGEITTLDLLALTPEQQIAATYAAFFGRGADQGGFTFWVDQFVKNLPTQGAAALFANIASSFAVGDEAKALYPFLANPAGASNAQIEGFLSKVYDNLFNRTPDAEGLAYWRGEIQNALKAGQFVGSVLVNVMSGAQNTAAGQDITALMSKVAVSLEYVRQQQLYGKRGFEALGATPYVLCFPASAPSPGHEFVNAVIGPAIDEAGQRLGEVPLRIDAVELAGLHQRGHGRPTCPAFVAGGEQRILPAEADRPDRAFHGVGVELDPAIIEEPDQTIVVVQCIPDCLRGRAAAG